jgi:acyl transferase domain-containing protein
LLLRKIAARANKRQVPVSQRPWPRDKPFASVNNFGFGGTNAHVILERAPLPPKTTARELPDEVRSDESAISRTSSNPRRLYVLTANDKSALEARVKGLGVYLEQRPEIFQNALMGNVAYTLGERRSLLPWRIAVPATSSFELISALSSASLMPAREIGVPRIGFVFTGQGAQWHAMGRELVSQYPVFVATLTAADKCLATLGSPFSLIGMFRCHKF